MTAISFNQVSYTYSDGREAIRNISFSIPKNTSTAIVGPNGAGKTTLLGLMCGLTWPCQGTIQVHDQPLTRRDATPIRRLLSLVFQNPNDQLFMPTVEKDIRFGLDSLGISDPDTAVTTALAHVGLTGFENRNTHHLSYGEKKRVCVAAALARQTPIILFDEPTNEFDPHARREFAALFNTISATRVLVCHDLNLVVDTCAHTLIVNNGTLVAAGETPTLLANADLMEQNRLDVPYRLR